MRRFGILLLTVAMICALSVSAFADGSKTVTDITEELPVLDVRATFSQGSPDVAYSVDISWGAMQFKYTVEADDVSVLQSDVYGAVHGVCTPRVLSFIKTEITGIRGS